MEKKGSNQAKREKEIEKKKRRGKREHSWRLSGLSPSNLLRGGGERQNKRHKKRMSQSGVHRRVARSKASGAVLQRGRPLPKRPSERSEDPGVLQKTLPFYGQARRAVAREPALLRENVSRLASATRTPTA